MIGLKRGLVKLEPYQEKWRNEAKQTIADLKSLLGDTAVDIQHIGSTAIPAIHAKPIIDIAVGVCDLKDIIPFIPLLENHNYIYRGQDAAEQILFVKGDFERDIRTHHVHVVRWNGSQWNNYLNFRDYLNTFPEKAMVYDACKRRLAGKFPKDRKRYTEGKQEMISKYLSEAELWKSNRKKSLDKQSVE